MSNAHPRVYADFKALQERYPSATLTELPSGAVLIALKDSLPPGWPVSEITLRFLAPNGYPGAQPDCFWVEPNLLLTGAAPRNSKLDHALPETEFVGHWFSWHIDQGRWSPNTDNLITWLHSCHQRLRQIL